MRNLLWVLFFATSISAWSQVKIGDNINTIDAVSILELESDRKAFVLTRLTDAQMNAITPLNGAMVYNTDTKCIYAFDGSIWKSLCNSEILVTTSATAPTNNSVGDIWINEAENTSNVWDGSQWVLMNSNPKSGDGLPSPTTVDNPIAGDIYVNRVDGNIFTYDGNTWVDDSNRILFQNGLTKNANNEVELGGTLSKPISIVADDINTLSLEGLELVDDNDNSVVTIDPNGVLQKASISALVQKEEIIIVANAGQNQFNTPLTITNPIKIDVYRNGVKIGFSPVGTNLIELETNVICYQNDEIRIVQFF